MVSEADLYRSINEQSKNRPWLAPLQWKLIIIGYPIIIAALADYVYPQSPKVFVACMYLLYAVTFFIRPFYKLFEKYNESAAPWRNKPERTLIGTCFTFALFVFIYCMHMVFPQNFSDSYMGSSIHLMYGAYESYWDSLTYALAMGVGLIPLWMFTAGLLWLLDSDLRKEEKIGSKILQYSFRAAFSAALADFYCHFVYFQFVYVSS